MSRKKLILIIFSIFIIIIGMGIYYFLNFQQKQALTNSEEQTLADGENLDIIDDIDLSDSGLDAGELLNVNMSLDFDQGLALETGESDVLSLPSVQFSAPAVPTVKRFEFDSSGLEDVFTQEAPASAQAEEDAQANQAAADAATAATAQAEADAKVAAGAPAETEDTTPPAETPTPPAQTGPTAAECAQFDSAPSCSYVPASSRSICEQCKAQ